jgi:IS5 family transposase
MQRQGSFAEAEYAGKRKQTRRGKFLADMEQVVPWVRLEERVRPLYPKGERGRPPIPLDRMLRVYFVQQWYGLGDEAVEDAFYDSQALRGFAGIDLTRDAIPDATRVLHFRHWLDRHDLTKRLFDEVTAMLEERGLLMRRGTIVDATMITAPPSTQNKEKSRDPEMHQTKKGNQWHFGMRAHIGVDVASGLCTRLPGLPPTKPTLRSRPSYCTGKKRMSSVMPATPGRTSGRSLPTTRYRGTSRSGAASSRHYRKACGNSWNRSRERFLRCALSSSTPSTSSRTASATRSCVIAASTRTPRSYIRCLLSLIW